TYHIRTAPYGGGIPSDQILRCSSCFVPDSSQSKITRETHTAVKTLAKRPITSVVAKPFTGPVPKINRKRQETIVVTCVSTMVHQAFPKPAATAAGIVLPALSSSRILSKIRTLESTAIPTVRIIPAMPGSDRD